MRPIAFFVVTSCVTGACVWGTYDGHPNALGNDASLPDGATADGFSWPSQTFSAGVGGKVISDDGLFSATIPPSSLNAAVQVTISRNLDPAGLPQFCQGKSVSCWGSAYTVLVTPVISSSNALGGPFEVAFALSPKNFNIPQNEAFIVGPGPQALPGNWATSGDVVGVQAAQQGCAGPCTNQVYGPYAIVHAPGAFPAANACGKGVCSACAQGCCSSAFAPPGGAGVHESCMCQGASPSTEDCMTACIKNEKPPAETCL